MNHDSKRLWIAWEEHRRSKELADAFDATLCEVIVDSGRVSRYFTSTLRTLRILRNERPDVLFAQAPSTVLCFLLSIAKPFFRYTLIVDAHNSVPNQLKSGNPVLYFINATTLRLSDFVIVTNRQLFPALSKHGGNMLCLPDRPPTIDAHRKGDEHFHVLIASYQPDEPIEQVLEAFTSLPSETRLYVTGKKPVNRPELLAYAADDRVEFTGFLSEDDYESLIASAALLIDLTTDDHILVCGGYEAIAVGVPSMVSDTLVSREVFCKGFLYAKPTVDSIREGLLTYDQQAEHLKQDIVDYKREYQSIWNSQFDTVKAAIGLSPTEHQRPNKAGKPSDTAGT